MLLAEKRILRSALRATQPTREAHPSQEVSSVRGVWGLRLRLLHVPLGAGRPTDPKQISNQPCHFHTPLTKPRAPVGFRAGPPHPHPDPRKPASDKALSCRWPFSSPETHAFAFQLTNCLSKPLTVDGLSPAGRHGRPPPPHSPWAPSGSEPVAPVTGILCPGSEEPSHTTTERRGQGAAGPATPHRLVGRYTAGSPLVRRFTFHSFGDLLSTSVRKYDRESCRNKQCSVLNCARF